MLYLCNSMCLVFKVSSQYWPISAQFQLFVGVPILLSQSSDYWTAFNNAFQLCYPRSVTQTCALFVTVCQNYFSLKVYQLYLLYVITSLRVILTLIWNWQRNVNKWEAVLLEGEQRLFCSPAYWHWVWQQTATLRDIKLNKISSKKQSAIHTFYINFYDHIAAAHSPSILCINFYIFRYFYHNKGTYGIAKSHRILKRFRPYLLVS